MKITLLIMSSFYFLYPALSAMQSNAANNDPMAELEELGRAVTSMASHFSNHGSTTSRITPTTAAAQVAATITCPACIGDFIAQHGARLSEVVDGYTPAQWATLHGNTLFLKTLLEHEVDVTTPVASTEETLLTLCMKTSKHNDCIELLIIIYLVSHPELIKTTHQQCTTQSVPFDAPGILMKVYNKHRRNQHLTLPEFATIMRMLYTPEPQQPPPAATHTSPPPVASTGNLSDDWVDAGAASQRNFNKDGDDA